MSIYTNFKNYTDTELEQEERRFNLEISNAQLADDAWQELNSFFAQNPDLKDKYRHSYWRWFVILSCQRALSSSDNTFLKLIEECVPVAILVNIDILEVLMRYLAQNYYLREDIGGYFLKLKSAFLQSKAVVGVWQGKNITVDDLAKEADMVYRNGDSLKRADFESRLRQIMFSGDEIAKKYFTADPEEAKERFLDLISFFQTFTEENIWFVVDAFINPEKYQNVPAGQAPPASANILTSTAPAPGKLVVPQTVRPATSPVPISQSAMPPLSASKSPLSTKPTPAQIKSQIEKEFSAEDVEGIMGKLNELAEKNNDAKIAEMYYFDETENKFKWNI